MGFNWWLDGHRANIELELGATRTGSDSSWEPELIGQTQLAF
jgi:hypothetical protein